MTRRKPFLQVEGAAATSSAPGTAVCCPLTEMALMQSRYVAFCTQLNVTLSCCVWSFRLLHFFSSAEDIVHHLTVVLGGAAKHRAVGKK